MNFTPAISLITSAERTLITTHARPDGDAVGTMVALKAIIDQLGRQTSPARSAQLLFLSEVGDNYKFLLSEEPWLLGKQITSEQVRAGALDQFDLIIVVDTSAIRQLPDISEYLTQRTQRVLVIDHHLNGDDIGSCRLVDVSACAAGEIVFELCRQAGWPLNAETASALFVAISTDTGWFRFENSSARAYRIAGALIEAGAQPNRLYQRLFQSYPPERLQLLARALQTIELHCDGRLVLMQITRQMLQETGARRTHIENIINECQQIDTVLAAVLLVEQDDGGTRCSLRSRAIIDVDAVARQFGGGGHARAAGAQLKLDLAEARRKLIAALTTQMPQVPAP